MTAGSPHAGWIAELLGGPLPEEPHATCDACAMTGTQESGELRFSEHTKCCTYTPRLANFLVGSVLRDESPEGARGRATVQARIARGAGVTPLGLLVTRTRRLLYDETGADGFGRAESLRCAHYLEDEAGTCGIWRHRNGICRTWFCKHTRGGVGRAFWVTVAEVLTEAENALSMWCALELGVDARLLAPPRADEPWTPIPAPDLDGRRSEQHAARWGRWAGREVELYEASAGLVETVRWADVARIGGVAVERGARAVREAYAALATATLPLRVRALSYRTIRGDRSVVRLQTYSAYDPIELPRVALELLPDLEASPLADARAQIADHHGIELTDDLVRRLIDFELLAPAD